MPSSPSHPSDHAPRLLRLTSCVVELPRGRVIRPDGSGDQLTMLEARALEYLIDRAGRVASRDELLAQVWGWRTTPITRAVDLAIRRLRKKIERDPNSPDHVVSAYGEGYRFVAAVSYTAGTGPVAGSDAVAHVGFPFQSTRFFGRGAELGALRTLAGVGAGVISVTGPGGVGKTRFAVQFADGWPGVAWFCDLTPCRSGSELEFVVARTLGVSGTPLEDAILAKLRGSGTALLVLDNFEQIAHEATRIRRWAVACRSVSFLVTTRHRLDLPDERVVVLDPLAEDDATALFIDRSNRAGGSGFAENHATTHAIVRHLDGLPLAVELAAARTPMLAPAQLLDRLRRSFKQLLARHGPEIDRRQATMEAAIAWSWDLLDPREREALMQCAVFRGGFVLDQAERVLAIEGDVGDALESLCAKSLIRIDPGTATGRYQVFEAVRSFAADRLADPAPVQRRHALTFARWARELPPPGTPGREQKIAAELPNIDAALEHACAAGLGDDAVDLWKAGRTMAMLRGWGLVLRQADAVLAAGPSAENRVAVLSNAGNLLVYVDPAEAVRRCREALDLVRREALDHLEPSALAQSAWACRHVADFDTALSHASLARELAIRSGDLAQLAEYEQFLAVILFDLGRLGQAMEHVEAAAEARRHLPSDTRGAELLNARGQFEAAAGALEASAATFVTRLELARRSGSRAAEAICLQNLAVTELHRGDLDRAAEHIGESRRIHEELHNAVLLDVLRIVSAMWCASAGALPDAFGEVERAVAGLQAQPVYRVSALALLLDLHLYDSAERPHAAALRQLFDLAMGHRSQIGQFEINARLAVIGNHIAFLESSARASPLDAVAAIEQPLRANGLRLELAHCVLRRGFLALDASRPDLVVSSLSESSALLDEMDIRPVARLRRWRARLMQLHGAPGRT